MGFDLNWFHTSENIAYALKTWCQHFQETLLLEGLTLQHFIANTNVMIPCETSFIAKKDAVIFVT